MKIDWNSYIFDFGGTEDEDMAAQKNASRRVFISYPS